MYKHTQRSWVGGRLDAELMGRQDLQKYFQGASELKNFHVRRQGYLSKRKGTEAVCDFKNLLGNVSEDNVGVYNSINKIKAIPLVYEKDKGYYILVARNRAYLVSKAGILLMNGEYAKRIDDSFSWTDADGNEKTKVYTLEEYEGNRGGNKAYSIGNQGYDTLQAAINHANSGDTIKVRVDTVEQNAVVISTAVKAILDLNGHNITFACTTAFLALNNVDAELRIVNSVNTEASLSHHNQVNINCVSLTRGHLILGNGGYIKGNGNTDKATGVTVGAAGKLTIDGGKLEAYDDAIVASSGSYIRIERGEVTSSTQSIISGTCKDCVINGGHISGVNGLLSGITATINGGVWECTNRPFYSNITINGGRYHLTIADYCYTASSVITKRGEFYCEISSSELTSSLKLGSAVQNEVPTRVVDGITYSGYKQSLESDYHYDLPADNYAPEKVEVGIPISQDRRPYYVTFPVSDEDLGAMDSTQSGDVIFFAHRSYAPFTVAWDGERLEVKKVLFSSSQWLRPRILSVKAKANSNFGDGATKTIYYVCTYVKDGIESEPSEPYGFSYGLPWGDKAALNIVCDKGNNIEEPDFYNIYKRDGVSYGLVATLGSEKAINVDVTIQGEHSATIIEQYYYRRGVDGGSDVLSSKKKNEAYYINNRFSSPVLSKGITVSGKTMDELVGGVTRGKYIEFDLGENSGVCIDVISLGLDAFTDRFEGGHKVDSINALDYYFSGEYFKVTLVTVNYSGEAKTFVKTASSFKPRNGQIINCGLNRISKSSGELSSDIASVYYRTLDVSFRDELEKAYPRKVSAAGSAKSSYQVKSIRVEAFNNAIDNIAVDLYINYVQFITSEDSNKEWEDDYVTPDMSLTPPKVDPVFNRPEQYPACVALYNQRLCYASSAADPFTFWMSCVGDLYNFNTHDSIREDDAITATLAATEFPEINHIVVNRDLMLLAESGEWQVSPVSGNTLSYKTIQSKMQSAIGCAKNLKPINVGDEIVFVKQSGETLLATRYNFTSDGYESQDLSVMSQWIFKNNPIVQMAYRQHPDSTIECVLTDGSVATLVYMKEHEVCAWSRHEFGGGWKARGVATNKSLSNGSTEVMFLVEHEGQYQMWKVRDDIPIRSNNKAIDHICLDALRELGEGETAEADMTVVKIGDKTYAGYLFEAELETIRPEPQGGETIQFELKNAKTAEVRVLDSGDFTVKPITASDAYAQAASVKAKINDDGTIDVKTTDLTAQLSGDNSGDGRIVLTSKTIYPLNILSVSTNYEIQPLSGSAG